jgi:hypothetical protein
MRPMSNTTEGGPTPCSIKNKDHVSSALLQPSCKHNKPQPTAPRHVPYGSKLCRCNHLSPTHIKPGQTLQAHNKQASRGLCQTANLQYVSNQMSKVIIPRRPRRPRNGDHRRWVGVCIRLPRNSRSTPQKTPTKRESCKVSRAYCASCTSCAVLSSRSLSPTPTLSAGAAKPPAGPALQPPMTPTWRRCLGSQCGPAEWWQGLGTCTVCQ